MKRIAGVSAALAILVAAPVGTASASAPAAVDRAAKRSVVAVSSADRMGAGVAWSSELVVTSARVMGDASSARVVTASGRVLDAEVQHKQDGLVTLRVEKSGLTGIARAKTGTDTGFVVGAPVGFSAGTGTVAIKERGDRLTLRGALPAAATGGPVLDDRGRLLGVVTTRLPAGGRAASAGLVGEVATREGGGGFPWPLLIAALLLAGAAAAITALVLRRRARRRQDDAARAQARAQRRSSTMMSHPAAASPAAPPPPPPPPPPAVGSEAPTVVAPRRRPAPPEQAAPQPDDDFEIVFRTTPEEGS